MFDHVLRANLAAVQDEFEERENRWNRIASLLDREDLISNSSSSTTSTLTNHHVPTVVNGIANNGILNQFSGGNAFHMSTKKNISLNEISRLVTTVTSYGRSEFLILFSVL